MTDHADTIRREWEQERRDMAEIERCYRARIHELEAELRQAQEERDRLKEERDNWHASNYAERQARLQAEEQRQQAQEELDAAIDALREARPYVSSVTEERDGTEWQAQEVLAKIDAALEKVGEKP